MSGSSTQGIKIVLHPVSDLETSKAVYAALLGIAPQADSSYYVGFDVEGQHIGLVPNGEQQGMASPVAPTCRLGTSAASSGRHSASHRMAT